MGRINESSRAAGRLKTIAALFLLLLLAAYATFLAIALYGQTRPLPQTVPAPESVAYERVTIESCDDALLAGWYAPGKNGAGIILLHDEGQTRAAVAAEAAELTAAGYSVLLYDRRGHGESSPVLRAAGWDDLGDVYNAWDWLAARPEVEDGQIALYGEGVGGQVALRAAAFSRRIYAVAARDPAPATGADRPAGGPAALHQRLLFAATGWRTGIPAPFPVVDVIQDIAPRPVLLLAPAGAESAVARHYFAQAQEPKRLEIGSQAPTLVSFFDNARAGDPLARQ